MIREKIPDPDPWPKNIPDPPGSETLHILDGRKQIYLSKDETMWKLVVSTDPKLVMAGRVPGTKCIIENIF